MKGQEGIGEYLATYGWAILVIVVVGLALFALGVLNPRANGWNPVNNVNWKCAEVDYVNYTSYDSQDCVNYTMYYDSVRGLFYCKLQQEQCVAMVHVGGGS